MNINLFNFHTIFFDFDGVFTDNKLYLSEAGVESVVCNRGDGLGLAMLKQYIKNKKIDIELYVLSKEKIRLAEIRMNKLRINCILSQDNKLEYIKSYLQKRFNVNPEKKLSGVIYFGNDLNDLAVMECVGLSFAPDDAHELIKSVATYVSHKKGGDGFVREAIELLINLNSFSKESLNEFISNC